jgi:hypothetical protein
MKAFFLGLVAGIILLLAFYLNSKQGAVKALDLVKARHKARIQSLTVKLQDASDDVSDDDINMMVEELHNLSVAQNALNKVDPESIDAQALADIIRTHLHTRP